MIKYDGIIHLENENIAVESFEVIIGSRKTIGGILPFVEKYKLILENNDQYVKLIDLDSFDIDFGNLIIQECTLNKQSNFKENIDDLGYLQCHVPFKHIESMIK